MKKTFSINVPNKKPERQVDAIKHEVKKYMNREKRKDLPENFDYWDFECRIGVNQDLTQEVHVSSINPTIDQLVNEGNEKFYLSVSAVPRKRQTKKK